ncbi:MAG TPA: NlpC/P60 family protein [Chthoniobacterales bacterium]|nr:NlpC/P60 family protein [Chthoniobacterales bacterium]
MLLRILIVLAVIASPVEVASPAETLGNALKKIFSTPTPTPRKKKTSAATKKKSPTPTATPAKKPSRAREEESPTPLPSPKRKKSGTPTEQSPSPTVSPKKKKPVVATEESPSPTPKRKKTSPTPSPSESPHHKKKGSPTPEPSQTPSVTPAETASPGETPKQSPATESPARKQHAPNATLLPNEIKGFENYPPKVQKLLTAALELTTRNLDYKYGSADPSTGGMDCSGFVYYVLKQNDVADVPRDSAEQYMWLRRAKQFEPVMSEKDDSFELEDLKPGDLLFWTGTYSIQRDPPITHAMIYLGREKKTGKRVMVGASDGRVYQGESRYGVSVFDFKVQRRETNGESKLKPTFIGYGHIPGLRD